jgi:hypothetical protein
MRFELAIIVVFIQSAVGPYVDMDDARLRAERQVVGVVLHHGREDDIVGPELEPAGQLVDSFGRVLHQDGHVLVLAGPDEIQDASAGLLIRPGRELRLEACAAVDAGVVIQESVDAVPNGPERRSGGSVVEVDVGGRAAAQERDNGLEADESLAQGHARDGCHRASMVTCGGRTKVPEEPI